MPTLPIDIDLSKIAQDLKSQAHSMAQRQASNMITDHFREAGTFRGATAGIGYTIIQEKIDKMLLSPEFEEKIDAMIEFQFEKSFIRALELACERAANKVAFSKIKEHVKRCNKGD